MIATLNLTKDNVYVMENGKLPLRQDFDKELLTGLARGMIVSKKGFNMLPNSIKKEVHCPLGIARDPNFPVTIKEIDALADIIIVVRSVEIGRGKEFRFTNFNLMLRQRDIELWVRK